MCKSAKLLSFFKKKKKESAPLNLFEGDIIKTLQHFCFHVTKDLCIPSNMEMKFCHTLILLYKVQFAVVPGIKTTQVTTQFDILLEGVKPLSAKSDQTGD